MTFVEEGEQLLQRNKFRVIGNLQNLSKLRVTGTDSLIRWISYLSISESHSGIDEPSVGEILSVDVLDAPEAAAIRC